MKLLEDLKKDGPSKKVRVFRKYLIYGAGLDLVLLSHYIREKFGKSNCIVISDSPILYQDLFSPKLDLLRGEDNLKVFKSLYPQISTNNHSDSSKFFKDSSFHLFNGRIRPAHKLLFNEDFFIEKGHSFPKEELFPTTWKDQEKIPFKFHVASAKSIQRDENGRWTLFTEDGMAYGGENLLFGQGPYNFLKLYNAHKKPSGAFCRFCAASKYTRSLIVNFVSNKKVTEEKGLIFIPQYVSQEKGHFIGEFQDFNTLNKKQEFIFMSFLEEEESKIPEEISKKIRLLRRNLKKIFPSMAHAQLQESVTISKDIPGYKVNDSSFDEINNEISNLFFFGPHAPLKKNSIVQRLSVSNIVRSFLSIRQIIESA